MSKVVVRPFEKEDAGFIFSTWSKGAYFGAPEKPPMSREQWFKQHYLYVCEALDTKNINIACLASDHSTVLGYSVVDKVTLEWVYVKKDFRRLGIAALLCQDYLKVSNLHMTKVGQAILDKRREKENGRKTHTDEHVSKGRPSGEGGVPPISM